MLQVAGPLLSYGLISMMFETIFFSLFCWLKLTFSYTTLLASSICMASCPNLKVLLVYAWCFCSADTLQNKQICDFYTSSKLSFNILVSVEFLKGMNLFLPFYLKARSLTTAFRVKRDRLMLFVSYLCCSLNWQVKTSLPQRSTTLNFLFCSSMVKTTCDLDDQLFMQEFPNILLLWAYFSRPIKASFSSISQTFKFSKSRSPLLFYLRLTAADVMRSVTFSLQICMKLHCIFSCLLVAKLMISSIMQSTSPISPLDLLPKRVNVLPEPV